LKLGAIEFQPTGSEVTGTVNFTNVTTGVTTSSNLNVGGTLQLGTVEVVATTHTLANTTAKGNVTPHTIEVSNVTTGLVTTANVSVGRDLTVTGNVAVDTNTLFVDSVNNRVGIGTVSPGYLLDVQSTSDAADKNMTRLYSAANASGVSSTGLRVEKGTGYGGIVKGFISQGVGSGLSLHTLNGGTDVQAMTIMNSGNVGIGTTSPDYTLDVNGTLGQNGKEIYAQRRWEIDLTAQSDAIFYPIEFKHPYLEGTPDLPDMFPVHFKVFGESLSGGVSTIVNENTLVGYAQGGGWSDHGPMYDVHVERHSAGEHRFQGLYEGNSGYTEGFVIYMRGGYRYSALTDASDVVTHTTTFDFTDPYANHTIFALKNQGGTDVSGTSALITQLVNIAGANGEQRWMSGTVNITQLGPIYNIPKTRAQIFELSTGSKYYDTTGFQDYTGYGAAWTAYSANPLYSISITGDYVNGTGGEINYRVVVENQSTSALSYFPNSTGFRKFHYVDHNRLDGHGYHGIMSGLTPGTSYKCKLQVIPTANASGTNNYNWNSIYGTITGIAWD